MGTKTGLRDNFVRTSTSIRGKWLTIIENEESTIVNSIDEAFELYYDFPITVYIIENQVNGSFHIGRYHLREDVHDVNYHYVHTLGSGTVGGAIRTQGVHCFTFRVLGKFCDLKEATRMIKFYRKILGCKNPMYDIIENDS